MVDKPLQVDVLLVIIASAPPTCGPKSNPLSSAIRLAFPTGYVTLVLSCLVSINLPVTLRTFFELPQVETEALVAVVAPVLVR